MTIKKVPLSLSEKNTLKKAFNFRLVLMLLGILPILATSAYLCFQTITDYDTNQYATETFIFCTGFFILCGYLFFKLVIPYYKQTFRNIRVENKLIIETVIIDIKSDWDNEFGYTYVIQTESQVPIISTINRLLNPSFGYKDLRTNMRIRIHSMDDKLMEILYIEPVN